MTTTKCRTVQREIDEADLDQQLTLQAAEHLRGCGECWAFQAERRGLRSLMGSLNPVTAPSDFDFRLRARIARDKSAAHAGNGTMFSRAIAVVAMVLLIAVAVLGLKSWLATNRNPTIASAVPAGTNNSPAAPVASTAPSAVSTPSNKGGVEDGAVAKAGGKGASVKGDGNDVKANQRRTSPNRVLRSNSTNASNSANDPGSTAIRDSDISPAPVLVPSGSPILVRLDPRTLKISIDNGRGTSRMISFPTVSFGSQRLLARESFQTPASSAKGVW